MQTYTSVTLARTDCYGSNLLLFLSDKSYVLEDNFTMSHYLYHKWITHFYVINHTSLRTSWCVVKYSVWQIKKTTWSKCLDEFQFSLDGIFHFKVCGLLCGHLGKNL